MCLYQSVATAGLATSPSHTSHYAIQPHVALEIWLVLYAEMIFCIYDVEERALFRKCGFRGVNEYIHDLNYSFVGPSRNDT